MEAVTPSGFTAINGRKLTPPGGYNVLPPEHPPTESSAHASHHRSILSLDQILNDPDVPADSVSDHEHTLNIDDFMAQSVEYDTDTITLKPTSDVDDQESSSSTEDEPKYSYSIVKGEAREMFGDKQPDFCVKHSKNEASRDVLDVDSDIIVEMKFRQWDGNSYGY